MFLVSISFSVLPVCSFWNCKCSCSHASLWTVLRDCSSSSTLWSSLLLFAMLSGFCETVNSPSYVRRLITLSGKTTVSIPLDLFSCR